MTDIRRGTPAIPVSNGSRDPLTGLLDRRGLEEPLQRRWEIARHRGLPSILVVADVDRFRRINEEHGRDAGDEVLKLVARLLVINARSSDLIGRIGGDEFLILLVGAKGEQPTPYLDRIAKVLAADERAPSMTFGWSRLGTSTGPEHAIDLASALMSKRRAVSGTRAHH